MSGAPTSDVALANSLVTALASLASQGNALAPISETSGASFSILRAASATRMPSAAKSRASDALSPRPLPTINAVSLSAMTRLPMFRLYWVGPVYRAIAMPCSAAFSTPR